jgi:TnpA family transposase
LPQIVNVTATYNIIKNYWAESTKYAELIKFIQEEKEKYIAKKLAEREKRKLFKRY